METPFAAILGLGLLLGMKHALDADHVVAVSTIVTENRRLWRSALIGAFWGLGHTLTLLLVGIAILGLALTIPERVALSFEFAVGVMLVLLGLLVIRRMVRERWHLHAHEHQGQTHLHWHSHRDTAGHEHGHLPYKSLLVGMVHGLAGSAALMLLVLATIKSVWEGILYILVFGAGSIGGMMLITTVIGLPFIWAARLERVHRVITAAAGLVSIGLGLVTMYAIGFEAGLFRP
jgi:ABC-type nickel/cobalt efflux system permease component RcnA